MQKFIFYTALLPENIISYSFDYFKYQAVYFVSKVNLPSL